MSIAAPSEEAKAAADVFAMIDHIERYGSEEIKTYMIEDKIWFRANDVARILGYKTPKKSVNQNVSEEDKKSLECLLIMVPPGEGSPNLNQNDLKTNYINVVGLQTFLTSSRSPNKGEFISWCKNKYGFKCEVINRLYKEQETIGQIIKVFSHKKHCTQYSVGSYRIDLYFPMENLAIECDEYGHRDRDQSYELERENYIKSELKCNFIRFNPDEKSFSIFDVINKIVKYFEVLP